MRILLLTRPICPPWDEGSKNFAYTLAKSFHGAEIHLLTYGRIEGLPRNVAQHQIYTSGKWNWSQKIRAYLFLVKEFSVRGGKNYDILHSFFTPTRLNVVALRLCLRNKKIKTIQTLATLRDDLYGEEKLKKIIHADLVVAYSDYAKKKLEKIGFDNVKRIYPGIDTGLFSPAPKKSELMERFATKETDFVINYTGEYVRLGDLDDIIEVFSDLAKTEKSFKLHLALRVKNEKDSAKKAQIKRTLKSRNILDRVAFIEGGDYSMEDIYSLCDISIFPARTMAGKFDIPLAVIEAMACAKPMIASTIERLRYFLNADNSILIEPGDREALKERIMYLYEDKETRDKLGKAGMEFVRKNFDIMKIVKEYEEIYKTI